MALAGPANTMLAKEIAKGDANFIRPITSQICPKSDSKSRKTQPSIAVHSELSTARRRVSSYTASTRAHYQTTLIQTACFSKGKALLAVSVNRDLDVSIEEK